MAKTISFQGTYIYTTWLVFSCRANSQIPVPNLCPRFLNEALQLFLDLGLFDYVSGGVLVETVHYIVSFNTLSRKVATLLSCLVFVWSGYISCNHVDGWWVTGLHMRRDWGPPLVWSETTNWDKSTVFIYSLITMITLKLHMVKFQPGEKQGNIKCQHF